MIWIWLAVYLGLALGNAFWLRRFAGFFQRVNDMNWQALVLVDIAAAFAVFWPLYLVGLLKERPLPWTTISTMCGGHSGKAWADRGGALIDALFFVLTGQRDHCAKAYAAWGDPLGVRQT